MRAIRIRTDCHGDEGGTTLILAVVFVLVIAIVLVAVGSLAANSLLNSSNARVQRTTTGDADAAVTIAMQYIRYQPQGTCPRPGVGTPAIATPPGATIPSADPRLKPASSAMHVYCTERDPLLGLLSRTVDFYACGPDVSPDVCTAANGPASLHAEVTYDDVNLGDLCIAPLTASCGIEMTVNFWDFGPGADT
jgi:hypothetical protein